LAEPTPRCATPPPAQDRAAVVAPNDAAPAENAAPTPGEADGAFTLAPEWADWLIDNYVEGVPDAAILEALVQGGVSEPLARAAFSEVSGMRALRKIRRKLIARDQLLELARLRGSLETPALAGLIERRANVSRQEFFERYFAANRPVILTDVTEGWPALELWKDPAYFAEKFGDEIIDVCMGREADPYCDRNFAKHVSQMTMRDYAKWVLDTEESNDGYLISNNRLLEKEAFHQLVADVRPPERYVDAKKFLTFMSFWFGPAGTRTPLHHDGNNILFCQVVGRKEFYLVSPWELGLLEKSQGYYTHEPVPLGWTSQGLRPADAEFPHPAVRIVLEPGEALFLPVGWWHQVRALDRSVSISFLNFWQDNHFEWYGPGKLNYR
jgi:hypothetical protein